LATTTKNAKLLRLSEAAEVLGIRADTLRAWSRRIPGFPQPRYVNNRPYYLASEIDEWLEQQRQRGGSSRGA
jgi:predicted DNA-binding transcriptional regulator AlpA